ncbi:MAG: DUF4058 family protein [Gemmataceae bacterium]
MPLRDHFHPPLYPLRHWESVHAMWSSCLTELLNGQWLPPGYFAETMTHANARVEIDVATYESLTVSPSEDGGGTATLAARVWTPPAPARTLPLQIVFPETYEVRVFAEEPGATLVAAIELVSPGNKDRPEARQGFAVKSANYLGQGVSLIMVDVVTGRTTNLHNAMMDLMLAGEDARMANDPPLYAVAYRPVLREEREEIDVWWAELAVGSPLPTLPLRLTGDLFIPIDLEMTYEETCRRLRLPV